jgi:hypothetical protein
LASGSATDDSLYASVESRISTLTARRNALAAQIRTGLNNAQFFGKPLSQRKAKTWIAAARGLIKSAGAL